MPTAESDRAHRVERRRARSPWCVGTTRRMPTRVTAASAAVTTKIDVQREVLEQRARHQDAERAAGAGEAGPDADGLGPLLRREDAGDRRQRAGHDQRRADAHERPQGDELVGRVGRAPTATAATPKTTMPGDERAPAPEAVAEGAGGQQQGGEGEARRRRRSTAATTGWRRGRRRGGAGRWRASRRPARPSPGPGTSRRGSSPGWRTRSWCRRRGRGRVGPVRATRAHGALLGSDRRGCGRGGTLDRYGRRLRIVSGGTLRLQVLSEPTHWSSGSGGRTAP